MSRTLPERALEPTTRPAGVGRSVDRLLDTVKTAVARVALALFAGMMLATLLQVAARYVFQVPIPWTEELARTLFVLAMLLAIPVAYREHEHVVVDFLLRRMPGAAVRYLLLVFDILVLFLLTIWARGALRMFEVNQGASLVSMPWFAVSWLYAAELAGVLLLAAFVTVDLVERARRSSVASAAR